MVPMLNIVTMSQKLITATAIKTNQIPIEKRSNFTDNSHCFEKLHFSGQQNTFCHQQ